MATAVQGKVIAVCKNASPGIPKHAVTQIDLTAGFGIEGDYHAGKLIRHRYLANKDPNRPNNRQVLIVDEKLISDIKQKGITVLPGQLGENFLVSDIGLMQLPIGTRLQIGGCMIELTEIRQPCSQLNEIHPDLMRTVMPDKNDPSTFNAGMLGIVVTGGVIKPDDTVKVERR